MSEEQTIERAILGGDWDAVRDAATAWMESETAGPRAFFALNVVYLLKGEFALAWKMYAKSLQEEADIANVREWVDRLSQTYPEDGAIRSIGAIDRQLPKGRRIGPRLALSPFFSGSDLSTDGPNG